MSIFIKRGAGGEKEEGEMKRHKKFDVQHPEKAVLPVNIPEYCSIII